MNLKDQLVSKLKANQACIGIFGLGYVGLPLALRYVETGYRVLGFDIDPEKVRKLNDGETFIEHIGADRVREARRTGLNATTDFSRTAECDALILCVPTPLTKYREPDLSFVLKTVDAILPYLRDGQVVSLESTTWPGTTDEELRPRIESRGFRVGDNAFLVFSPEREDPGNPNFSTSSIPKVVGGCTPDCLDVGLALYGKVIDRLVPVSSTRAAEMTKLLENIHRAVNIGLVNELKIVCHKMGIDIYEVIRAAATKPFGFTPYYPGPGLGGHCIPIDPFYLTWKAREYGLNTRFIELAGEVNTGMPEWVVGRIAEALNDRQRSLRGAKVLVLGVAYKKNVGDMRESPSMEIMTLLRDKGVLLEYSDPHVPSIPPMREHHFDLRSVALTRETLRAADCVVIATDHAKFDYDLVQRESHLVVDCRGVYQQPFDNVERA